MSGQPDPITPQDIPVHYSSVIEDLLLAILNSLPAPDGIQGHFLNGKMQWAYPTISAGGGELPTGQGTGDILVYNADTLGWEVLQRSGVFKMSQDKTQMTLQLTNDDVINFDGTTTLGANKTGQLVLKNGEFEIEQGIRLGHDIAMKNKAQTGFIPFATRDITGTEAAMNLDNVRRLNDRTNLNHRIGLDSTTGQLWSHGIMQIGPEGSASLYFMMNGVAKMVFTPGGTLEPYNNPGCHLGSVVNKFNTGFFSNYVSAPTFSNDDGTTKFSIGAKANGAVTPSAGGYIPITINGVTYKLIIAQ